RGFDGGARGQGAEARHADWDYRLTACVHRAFYFVYACAYGNGELSGFKCCRSAFAGVGADSSSLADDWNEPGGAGGIDVGDAGDVARAVTCAFFDGE